jgi:hypothetical protein
VLVSINGFSCVMKNLLWSCVRSVLNVVSSKFFITISCKILISGPDNSLFSHVFFLSKAPTVVSVRLSSLSLFIRPTLFALLCCRAPRRASLIAPSVFSWGNLSKRGERIVGLPSVLIPVAAPAPEPAPARIGEASGEALGVDDGLDSVLPVGVATINEPLSGTVKHDVFVLGESALFARSILNTGSLATANATPLLTCLW